MIHEPNTVHWKVGDQVIHDSDAKTDKMLMVVIGYTREGEARTKYVDPTISKKTYTNPIEYLHDPMRPDIRSKWRKDNGESLMRLWLLVRDDASGYDIATEAVVRALDEGQARWIASENCGDEGPNVWLDPQRTSCVQLAHEGEAGLIIQATKDG